MGVGVSGSVGVGSGVSVAAGGLVGRDRSCRRGYGRVRRNHGWSLKIANEGGGTAAVRRGLIRFVGNGCAGTVGGDGLLVGAIGGYVGNGDINGHRAVGRVDGDEHQHDDHDACQPTQQGQPRDTPTGPGTGGLHCLVIVARPLEVTLGHT